MQKNCNFQEISLVSKELARVSEFCGCFHCFNIFGSNLISDWTSNADELAVCPYCGSDSLVGDFQGAPITKDALREARSYYF